MIILRRPHVRQPTQALQIDRGSKLGAACLAAVVPSIPFEAVSVKAILRGTNVGYEASEKGLGFRGSSSNSDIDMGATGGLSSIVSSGTAFTILLRAKVTTTTGQQYLIGDHDSSASNLSIRLQVSAGFWNAGFVDTSLADKVLSPGAASLGWHDIAIKHEPGVGGSISIDGSSEPGSGYDSTSFALNLASGTSFRIGSEGAWAVSNGFQGETAFFYMFKGDLFSEALALSRNPWSLFASRPVLTSHNAPPIFGTLGQFDPELRIAAWF